MFQKCKYSEHYLKLGFRTLMQCDIENLHCVLCHVLSTEINETIQTRRSPEDKAPNNLGLVSSVKSFTTLVVFLNRLKHRI